MSDWKGVLLSVAAGAGFVGMMYVPKAAREDGYVRDHKDNIKKRLLGAAAVSISSCVTAGMLDGNEPLASRIGVGNSLKVQLLATGSAALSTAMLFMGVCYERYDNGTLSPDEVSLSSIIIPKTHDDYQTFRNYVAAPLTEEIVFRVCISYFMKNSNWSLPVNVFTGITLFSAAHIHHLYFYVQSCQMKLKKAILVILSNFVVHSIFGLMSSLIYVRTGSLFASTVSHAMCNYLHAPSFEFLDGQLPFNVRLKIFASYFSGITLFLTSYTTLFNPSLYDSIYYK
eukprot:TRINITY_DN3320_c0_g1_i1.p1 TRINITY_DN3320_c0_g1~~TRINITY_DN3320_c0_g1_i1.p1  ORF type:complete len:284 (+),score=38.39 TRINITY_DN3320_c0_g1_i1:48-899(+)